jgi:hypothetical protein
MAKDDVPRAVSPAPLKKQKEKTRMTKPTSTSTLIDVSDEPPAADDDDDDDEPTDDEQILDVLALLDLDEWTTLDYSEQPN